MVRDGDEVHAADVLAKIPARHHQDQGHHRRSAARRRIVEARKPRDPPSWPRFDGVIRYGEISKGTRKGVHRRRRQLRARLTHPRGAHISGAGGRARQGGATV